MSDDKEKYHETASAKKMDRLVSAAKLSMGDVSSGHEGWTYVAGHPKAIRAIERLENYMESGNCQDMETVDIARCQLGNLLG